MKQTNSWTKELLPYASAFIIIVGIIRIQQFYQEFDINIVQFISLSEVFTLLLDVIRAPLFSVVLVIIISSVVAFIKENMHGYRIRISAKSDLNWKVMLVLLFIMFSIQAFMERRLPHAISLITLGISIIFTGIFVEQWIFRKKKNTRILSFLFCACVFYMLHITYYDVTNVKYNKKYAGTTLYFTDGTKQVSDSTDYFIGKTADYIFVHHAAEKTTEAIPTGNIKGMRLRSHAFDFLTGGISTLDSNCVAVFP